ncbi:hypothetical protein [Scandinavium goeteborgense]|uniref:Uncharacterized protein n=1 Tax=Scandinavium goeteborgense TaxID=1851514 RepID=A0A4R6DSF3_SCAGO|nr:hypothetical protein [Scandinavium goeteborgense]TDN48055.1 hypothetical protein EC847_1285 [Scandinavium goeteborgense]
MSQYRLTGITPGGDVEILLGWDAPMSWYFLVIGPEHDEPLYSNLYEPDPASLDLAHFQRVLERFGIRNINLSPGHASGIFEALESDRLNGK